MTDSAVVGPFALRKQHSTDLIRAISHTLSVDAGLSLGLTPIYQIIAEYAQFTGTDRFTRRSITRSLHRLCVCSNLNRSVWAGSHFIGHSRGVMSLTASGFVLDLYWDPLGLVTDVA